MANSMVVYKDLSVACLLMMVGWPGSNGWLVYVCLFGCIEGAAKSESIIQ